MSLKERIRADMTTAMRAKDTVRLSAIRLLLAAIGQKEVDTQKALDDAQIISIVEKLSKQRKDSLAQYEAANREDLASIERTELVVLSDYLPEQMSDQEIDQLIDEAMSKTGASGMSDMGKLMAYLKPLISGKADMSSVSARVKARL